NARAHEGELSIQIQHQDQIREALQQTAAEFLLAPQLPLHRALLGHIDQRALVTHDAAVFNDSRGSVLADGDAAIFLSQPHFARARAASLAPDPSQRWIWAGIDFQSFRRKIQHFFFAGVAQDRHERRVHFEQLAVGRAHVHALLESLEQLGEALLFVALGRDITRQHAGTGDVTAFYNRVHHTVVIEPPAVLELDADHARPGALVKKSRQVERLLGDQRSLQEFLKFVAHDIRVRFLQYFRDPPVYRP